MRRAVPETVRHRKNNGMWPWGMMLLRIQALTLRKSLRRGSNSNTGFNILGTHEADKDYLHLQPHDLRGPRGGQRQCDEHGRQRASVLKRIIEPKYSNQDRDRTIGSVQACWGLLGGGGYSHNKEPNNGVM